MRCLQKNAKVFSFLFHDYAKTTNYKYQPHTHADRGWNIRRNILSVHEWRLFWPTPLDWAACFSAQSADSYSAWLGISVWWVCWPNANLFVIHPSNDWIIVDGLVFDLGKQYSIHPNQRCVEKEIFLFIFSNVLESKHLKLAQFAQACLHRVFCLYNHRLYLAHFSSFI